MSVKDRDPRFADIPCRVAGVVPAGARQQGGWMASEWLTREVLIFFLSLFLCLEMHT